MYCIFLTCIIISVLVSTSCDFIDYSINQCVSGEIVENDCNVCVCNSKRIFDCFTKQCDETTEDRSIEKVYKCQPNMMYALNDTICICNKLGEWPHKDCGQMFKSFPANNMKRKCKPNNYVIINCNVCRCNAKGEIDTEHCTKNKCKEEVLKPNQLTRKSDLIYGHCEIGGWYSLGPCQMCRCINDHQLKCTAVDTNLDRLEVGDYNISICNQNLIKEALDLVPKNDNVLRKRKSKDESENDSDSDTDSNDIQDNKSEQQYFKQNRQVKAITATPRESSKSSESSDSSTEESKEEKYSKAVDEKSKDFVLFNTNSLSSIYDKIKSSVDVDLPAMFDKLLRMPGRKSMVNVLKNSNCVPGATEMVDCNTCYCLKNGKMICTNKSCS